MDAEAVQRRRAIADRLGERRAEIEEAVLARTDAIADPTSVANPLYLDGLRSAMRSAIEYGLETIALGEDRAPPPPVELLSQARVAARAGVRLDTVLRRYVAGYALLGDFIVQAATETGLDGDGLQELMLGQAALFERLLGFVTDEFEQETAKRLDTSEQRRAERVRRLLEGEKLDTGPLAYEFEQHHLALIVKGSGAGRFLRELSTSLGSHLLLARPDSETAWGWLGGRQPLAPAAVEDRTAAGKSAWTALTIGEPGEGIAGWRLSHRQASAALPIACREEGRCVRYADVALLASMQKDDLLVTSLRQLYLAPLEDERDGGRTTYLTLWAYLLTGCNSTAAAAILEVSRQTVNNRVRNAEDRLGFTLIERVAELTMALRLELSDGDLAERNLGETATLQLQRERLATLSYRRGR